MTLEELRRLAASNWTTIGAHTVHHITLSVLAEEEQRQEIISARKYLEEFLQRKISVFSYPFGAKRDYTATTRRICREVGFSRAASNFPGQAHRWTDPFQIPRQLVRNWDLETFATMMRSFWI